MVMDGWNSNYPLDATYSVSGNQVTITPIARIRPERRSMSVAAMGLQTFWAMSMAAAGTNSGVFHLLPTL